VFILRSAKQNPLSKGKFLSERLNEDILLCINKLKAMSKGESDDNKRGNHWFSNFGHDRQMKSVSSFSQNMVPALTSFKTPDLTAFHKKNKECWEKIYKGSALEDLT